jgi:hypothetical protein
MAALRTVLAELALPSATQAPGTYVSGQIANPGYAMWVDVSVHVSAVTGASPTLDVHLESSPDNVTWALIPGTLITQLTAAGNARCSCLVNSQYVRVTSIVGGSATTVTYAVATLVIPE